MVAGPFDQRKQRSRCIACSASHLKCFGGFPCLNCLRRAKLCELPVRDLSITLDAGKTPTKDDSTRREVARTPPKLSTVRPALDVETVYVLAFFNDFLPRNNFTGRSASPWLSIQSHLTSHAGVVSIVCAIGALQRAKNHQPAERHLVSDALRCYTTAITNLRHQIVTAKDGDLLRLSWSTFLLGLFELMCDDTGQGWVWHMLYGTSRILQSLTPNGCRTGAGREFFLEIRIFEIARSMLFGEKSFLASKPWTDFTQELWLGDHAGEWSPADRLLDIMTLVADLCVRIMGYTHSNLEIGDTSSKENDHLRTLMAFAEEGQRLRSDLILWEEMAQLWPTSTSSTSSSSSSTTTNKQDHQMMIAWIFYPAISIYLSGIYDYDPTTWSLSHNDNNNIITTAVPVLSQDEIQANVNHILDRTAVALEHTNVTPLVFLFPLRIAGARSTTTTTTTTSADQQQRRIRALLAHISCSFSVANAISSDLGQVWAEPVVITGG